MRRLASFVVASLVLSLGALGALGALAACSAATAPFASGGDAGGLVSDRVEISCDAASACSDGRLIGSVSGDMADAGLTAIGTTSSWVHVRVTEDNSDWTGHPMQLHATLTSPQGAAFELHAFLDTSRTSDAGLDCAHEVGTAVHDAKGSTLDITWGDPADASANGVDDGRTVALEVRHLAGQCHAGAPWTLAVLGGP